MSNNKALKTRPKNNKRQRPSETFLKKMHESEPVYCNTSDLKFSVEDIKIEPSKKSGKKIEKAPKKTKKTDNATKSNETKKIKKIDDKKTKNDKNKEEKKKESKKTSKSLNKKSNKTPKDLTKKAKDDSGLPETTQTTKDDNANKEPNNKNVDAIQDDKGEVNTNEQSDVQKNIENKENIDQKNITKTVTSNNENSGEIEKAAEIIKTADFEVKGKRVSKDDQKDKDDQKSKRWSMKSEKEANRAPIKENKKSKSKSLKEGKNMKNNLIKLEKKNKRKSSSKSEDRNAKIKLSSKSKDNADNTLNNAKENSNNNDTADTKVKHNGDNSHIDKSTAGNNEENDNQDQNNQTMNKNNEKNKENNIDEQVRKEKQDELIESNQNENENKIKNSDQKDSSKLIENDTTAQNNANNPDDSKILGDKCTESVNNEDNILCDKQSPELITKTTSIDNQDKKSNDIKDSTVDSTQELFTQSNVKEVAHDDSDDKKIVDNKVIAISTDSLLGNISSNGSAEETKPPTDIVSGAKDEEISNAKNDETINSENDIEMLNYEKEKDNFWNGNDLVVDCKFSNKNSDSSTQDGKKMVYCSETYDEESDLVIVSCSLGVGLDELNSKPDKVDKLEETELHEASNINSENLSENNNDNSKISEKYEDDHEISTKKTDDENRVGGSVSEDKINYAKKEATEEGGITENDFNSFENANTTKDVLSENNINSSKNETTAEGAIMSDLGEDDYKIIQDECLKCISRESEPSETLTQLEALKELNNYTEKIIDRKRSI